MTLYQMKAQQEMLATNEEGKMIIAKIFRKFENFGKLNIQQNLHKLMFI